MFMFFFCNFELSISAKLWLSPTLWCSENFPPRHPYDETRPATTQWKRYYSIVIKKQFSSNYWNPGLSHFNAFFCIIMLFHWHSHILAYKWKPDLRSLIWPHTHIHVAPCTPRKCRRKSFPEADVEAKKISVHRHIFRSLLDKDHKIKTTSLWCMTALWYSVDSPSPSWSTKLEAIQPFDPKLWAI